MSDTGPSRMLSLGWRAGLVPGGANIPDGRLRELVEGRDGGPDPLRPGRALDLGSGMGRNAIYLAQRGWDVVAIDLAGYAMETARRRAADADATVRFIHGDVTKLPEFNVGDGFSLIVDVGCYQALPEKDHAAHAATVTRIAEPGATLLMLAIMHIPGKPSLTPEDVQKQFPGWELVAASPVRTSELNAYNKGVGARVLSAAMSRFKARRYELKRKADLPVRPCANPSVHVRSVGQAMRDPYMSISRQQPQSATDLPKQTQVAIIGAGPTGLSVALALANKGIDHVIVDKSAPHLGRSRAATVMPLSLELLEEFGVVDKLVAHGLKLDGFAGRDRKRRLASFAFAHLPTKYPYVLVIPQSLTEELMESGLIAAGGGVHRPHELAGLTQDGDGVTLTFTDGQTLRACYVVGADGSRSMVREAVGIDFVGYSYPISVVLADIDVALDPDRVRAGADQDMDRVRGFLTPHGSMAVVPLPSGRWRIAAPMHEAVRDPDLDQVRALVRVRAPRGIPGEITGLEWASHFQVQRRHAERYRAGRAFLAGDAAHVHSPVAGQGMNVGIQDGVNLGRKLAAVFQGADPGILDMYETERRGVAAKVITTTDRLTRSLMIHSWVSCTIRNSLLRVIGTSSRLENQMSMHNSQLVYRGL